MLSLITNDCKKFIASAIDEGIFIVYNFTIHVFALLIGQNNNTNIQL